MRMNTTNSIYIENISSKWLVLRKQHTQSNASEAELTIKDDLQAPPSPHHSPLPLHHPPPRAAAQAELGTCGWNLGCQSPHRSPPASILPLCNATKWLFRYSAFLFFSFTHLNPFCLWAINRIDHSIYLPISIYPYLYQMYRRCCPYLAAHANGILYCPSLWHACLAFFSTFWATLKTSESSHEMLNPTDRIAV